MNSRVSGSTPLLTMLESLGWKEPASLLFKPRRGITLLIKPHHSDRPLLLSGAVARAGSVLMGRCAGRTQQRDYPCNTILRPFLTLAFAIVGPARVPHFVGRRLRSCADWLVWGHPRGRRHTCAAELIDTNQQ